MSLPWLDAQLFALADWLGTDTFVLNSLIAISLVGLTCGLVGATVVSSRMAFFSDAMAHTAFAGIAFAVLGVIVLAGVKTSRQADEYNWLIQPVMVAVGVIAGTLIVFVRERTGLATDTVIGVFFAAAIGFGAMILPNVRGRVNLDPESFLYGSVTLASGGDIFVLACLSLVTITVICWRFNALALASFSPSLARSRGVSVRLNNYIFVILLAVIVNVTIKSVGVLLVNALLIVPAAAAANIGRNLRAVFWLTLLFTIGSAIGGLRISHTARIPIGGAGVELAPSGAIVLMAVGLFMVSLIVAGARGRLGGGMSIDRAG